VNPTEVRVLKVLKERGRVTAAEMCTEFYVPYHMVPQVMVRMGRIDGVTYTEGALVWDDSSS
jgi:hypothetical protein